MNTPLQILYLEDNPLDAELVRDHLRRNGTACELRVARDRTAYEAALAGTCFDLILSDYSLPGYDGMAALALAREQYPGVPFILVSGALGEDQAVDCVLRGATDFVLKHRLARLVPAVLRALSTAEEQRQQRAAAAALRESEAEFRTLERDLTDRKRAEEALQASEARLRQLAVELSRVEEQERLRLAACLHDEIVQVLALLRLKLGTLAATLPGGPARAAIAPLRDLLEATIDQTRSLVFDLSPPVLHELGLTAALEWAGEKICREHGLTFVCHDDGQPKPVDDGLKMLLFRCARELMMNTVRHAQATRMTVTLERLGARLGVTVGDDGCGFDLSRLDCRTHGVGFGLFSVRERLVALGGDCRIESEAGVGTWVTLTAPTRVLPESGAGGESPADRDLKMEA